MNLPFLERLRGRRHHHDDHDELPRTQRDRLAVLCVAGTTDLPARALAERRLVFAWELARDGRIGEGADSRETGRKEGRR